MVHFNLEQLAQAHVELEQLIDVTTADLIERARDMLNKGDIDTPTVEQLEDVALILSGLDNMDYNFTLRRLQCFITFQMEQGVKL